MLCVPTGSWPALKRQWHYISVQQQAAAIIPSIFNVTLSASMCALQLIGVQQQGHKEIVSNHKKLNLTYLPRDEQHLIFKHQRWIIHLIHINMKDKNRIWQVTWKDCYRIGIWRKVREWRQGRDSPCLGLCLSSPHTEHSKFSLHFTQFRQWDRNPYSRRLVKECLWSFTKSIYQMWTSFSWKCLSITP